MARPPERPPGAQSKQLPLEPEPSVAEAAAVQKPARPPEQAVAALALVSSVLQRAGQRGAGVRQEPPPQAAELLSEQRRAPRAA